MAQFNWTYVSDSGAKHVVGLFHGENTGHVLVHCNSQILLIDFQVLESKNYSFFIEDELCELKLERKGSRFEYGLEINREVDTPKNRERRAIEKKHLRLGLMLVGGLALMVAIFVVGLRYYQRERLEQERPVLLANNSNETVARVVFAGGPQQEQEINYSFVANGQIYEGKARAEPSKLPHGIPLEAGDEFVLRYAAEHPSVHEIEYDKPTQQQITRYRQRAFDKHATLHPELDASRINCVLDVLHRLYGLSAYAEVLFQDKAPARQAQHNRETYEKMVTDPAVVYALGDKCR